jgi:hypothetical protein
VLNNSHVPRSAIYSDIVADERLRILHIPGTPSLLQAVSHGAQAARSTSAFHPRAYRGQRMWAETHAALGNLLHGDGWEPANFLGADLVLHNRSGLAIIVTAGDTATGNEHFTPQVRYERQEVITGLVNGHADTIFRASEGERPEWTIWFLLHHLGGKAIQAELSRPQSIHGGWVSTWAERILLPTIGDPRQDRPKPRRAAEIDVPVGRRLA